MTCLIASPLRGALNLMNEVTANRKSCMQIQRDAGFSDSQIAKIHGVTRQAVHAVLGKRAIDQRKGRTRINFDRSPTIEPKTEADRLLPMALREWRARHNLTQSQVCEILHVDFLSTYQRWEKGERSCRYAELLLDFIKLWEFTQQSK